MESNLVINLLWTGGWDSTFRLLYILFVENNKVQPYYIIDTERKSFPLELMTMSTIRRHVMNKFPDSAELMLPTFYRTKNEIRENIQITNMYRILRNEFTFSRQFEYLSRFAHEMNISDMELSVESDLIAIPGHNFFQTYLRSNVVKTSCGSYHLSDNLTDRNLRLFRYFRFPILDLTKHDMKRIAEQNGFIDILEKSWYCLTPMYGTIPCGTCNPCRFLLKQGVSRRMTFVGNCRYHIFETYLKLRSKLQL